MNVKRILFVSLFVLLVFLSFNAVSAGWFGDESSSNDGSDEIPMETKNIEDLLKISTPVDSEFEYGGELGNGHFSLKNIGEYDADVMAIVYTPYEFESSTSNDFYEQDGDLKVYVDSQIGRIYYVDKIIDGNTVSLQGTNLELLKEMANSIELIN